MNPEILRWLEKRSFENLIHFYREELRQVHETGLPPAVPGNVHQRMARDGLIRRVGKLWALTPEAWRCLYRQPEKYVKEEKSDKR